MHFHLFRAKTMNMAHNQSRNNVESVNINGIINNAIQSISRLRDMQSQPTIASEVVLLFPMFQQPAALNNYQEVHSRGASGGAINQQCLNNSGQSRAKLAKNKKKKKVRLIHKDIVFILKPTVNKVPTHHTILKLESKSRIIHDFTFDRDSPECSAIEEEMPMSMTVEYEFLNVLKKKLNLYYGFIPPRHDSSIFAIVPVDNGTCIPVAIEN